MLRAVSSICIETQALELLTASRRDVFKVFRAATLFSTAPSTQTVLSAAAAPPPGPAASGPPTRQPPPGPPPPPPPRGRGWLAATTAAIAVSSSIGGIYFYRKYNEDKTDRIHIEKTSAAAGEEAPLASVPALASELPAHVEYLVVGGGTAAFAALRALRAAQPGARVLLVADEHALPYMRPPLSKELWREPGLAQHAASLDTLTFAQWNGKRRSLLYEPDAFYTPVARLAAGEAGAGVALGWRAERLHVTEHAAELRDAGGSQRARVAYDKCLLATGVRPRRAAALRAARGAGRALAVRGVRDVRALAAALARRRAPTLAVLGGGFLASELSASIADTLKADGGRVIQIFREGAALARVLPDYLAADASSRLRERGVTVVPNSEVVSSHINEEDRVVLSLADGSELTADLVLECVGSELDESLARASGLELHPTLGGLVVNAELQARADVYVAGDAACFHDVALGRRRVEHHDHAVLSGRRAGANMAGDVRPYDHQSMFWSDLGPELGFEAIGIVDSKLPTVGVFSEDAVLSQTAGAMAAAASADTADTRPQSAPAAGADTRPQSAPAAGADTRPEPGADTQAKRYERGVVFYMREKRVVGVLLWNLFNRMHVARQVMAQGEFEDLFEVAKLFAPQDED